MGLSVKQSSFACSGLKTCKELCIKTTAEANVTSTQSEHTSVDEHEGPTTVIFFPSRGAEKNLNLFSGPV